jgi:hypothetical protein
LQLVFGVHGFLANTSRTSSSILNLLAMPQSYPTNDSNASDHRRFLCAQNRAFRASANIGTCSKPRKNEGPRRTADENSRAELRRSDPACRRWLIASVVLTSQAAW